jgi:NAD(P)H-flavin reductase
VGVKLEDPMIPRPATVTRVVRETEDVFTIDLDVTTWPGGFRFSPGQFTMLYQFGIGEVPLSISGDPASPDRIVHTIRSVGSVTQAMDRIEKGETLGVRGPYGSAWPLESARGRDLVLVAGGLGLAPLRPALYHALAHRDEFGRVVLVYGTRSPDALLFERELRRWRGRPDLEVQVTVDQAGRDWRGDVGLVTALLPKCTFDSGNTVALLCGPEVMMRFAARELERLGVAAGAIHVSLERNMKCAVGFCGHCQLGPTFICKDGPVFPLDRVRWLLETREL